MQNRSATILPYGLRLSDFKAASWPRTLPRDFSADQICARTNVGQPVPGFIRRPAIEAFAVITNLNQQIASDVG